ncbi:MAG: B12-binding domain-containing radical SAM protein [Thaumarchaeota archaeon]|nr:B12-binding domain-containing radical SAM protein [Nitrososphaerota archaeon]MCL5318560.1 B12-binding domain-containing radical SAM protein [Nitrososphaerota archaeon]
MKIAISYPPITSEKGIPLLSQNRQFQYFHAPTYIYPVVPAYAATLLKEAGHDVAWVDGIAGENKYGEWLKNIEQVKPDVMMIETKTPTVKRHWTIIDDVKEVSQDTKVVLVGDHVTYLARESMEHSKADYVLEGGDYDFLFLNLVQYLDDGKVLEPGIWFRDDGEIKNTGRFQLNHDVNSLPFIDRDLTRWRLYSEKNGNFKSTPGTYTMVGRDCWWRNNGGCTFCSWPTLYPNYRVRKPELLVEEIGMLIENQGVKEVFDDTGTFPIGSWLKRFSQLMIEGGYNERIRFSCNMRFGVLSRDDYRLLRKAGFRMLLFGLESGNQYTLGRLNKGIRIEDAIRECKVARQEGLEPHITVMVGYPWERHEDALKTSKMAKELIENGWASTLQSTVVIPYPGTKLYDEAKEEGWFRVDPFDYDRFDMTEPVLETVDMTPEEVMGVCDEIYKVFLSPKYMLRHLLHIRSWRDVKYSFKGIAKVIGHVKDFGRKRENRQ